jgi:hypothetical protein
MTKPSTTDREALRRLKDALVKDILDEPDEETAAAAADDGIDLERDAQAMREMFEATVIRSGKERLAAARAAMEASRVTVLCGASGSRGAIVFQENAANDQLRLTMAARNGSGQSERDLEGVKEDLAELAAIQEEPRKED